MGKTKASGMRLDESVMEQLDAEAARRGMTRAELVRVYIDRQLRETRREHLREMRRVADDLAEQARSIFKNLPAGEIEDEDPLGFDMTDAGNILIRDPQTSHDYMLFEGVAVRLRLLGDRVELTFWKDGEQIDEKVVPLEEAKADAG